MKIRIVFFIMGIRKKPDMPEIFDTAILLLLLLLLRLSLL